MTLSKQAKEALQNSQTLQGKIADAFRRTIFSVNRWIVDDSDMLTTPTAVKIISEETGLTEKQIINKGKAA